MHVPVYLQICQGVFAQVCQDDTANSIIAELGDKRTVTLQGISERSNSKINLFSLCFDLHHVYVDQ